MKAVISGREFAEAVAAAARVVPRRPYTPALGGLLVQVVSDLLTVSATDFDASITTTMPASVGQEGKALLSGPLLAAIAAMAKASDTVHVGLDDDIATVAAGRSRWQVPTLAVEDYPALREVPPVVGSVDAAEWSQAIAQTAFAVQALKDGQEPGAKNGVQILAEPEGAKLVASDGYRIAERDLTTWKVHGGDGCDVLLPPAALSAARFGGDGRLHLHAGTDVFGLTDDRRATTLRPLATTHRLPVASLMAVERPHVLSADTGELLAAVKHVAIAAENVGSGLGTTIAMELDGETLGLQCVGEGAGATASVPVQYDGPPLSWGMGPHLLLDVLPELGDVVHVHSPGPSDGQERAVFRPLLLTPAPLADSPSYRHVVMPRKR